jgi:hypothetical protein
MKPKELSEPAVIEVIEVSIWVNRRSVGYFDVDRVADDEAEQGAHILKKAN